jgi:hypothetical protein
VDIHLATRHVPVTNFTHKYPRAYVFLPPLLVSYTYDVEIVNLKTYDKMCFNEVLLLYSILTLSKPITILLILRTILYSCTNSQTPLWNFFPA